MPPRHAEAVYETGAEDFERLAPALWNPMGNAVAAAADLGLADRVVDVFCGSGASTIPAAQFVGPDGGVSGLDSSAGLLDLARAKADAMSLSTISFDLVELATFEADLLRHDGRGPAGWTEGVPFDAVLCCYGLTHFADLASGTAALAGLLRPGGRIALSSWDAGAHAEFLTLFQESCSTEAQAEGSVQLARELANREQLSSPEKLSDWLLSNGFSTAGVDAVPLEVPLDQAMAWSFVQGTMLSQLLPGDPSAVERIRLDFAQRVGDGVVLDARSLVAVATTAD